MIRFALLILPLVFTRSTGYSDVCGSGTSVCPKVTYRPDDGSCNTPKKPQCGSIGDLYARLMPSRIKGRHGLSVTKSGKPLPNARVLSAGLFPYKETIDTKITLNVMQYGQLITHDLAFTYTQPSPLDCCTDDMHFISPPPTDYECASVNVTTDPFYEKYDTTCVSMYRTQTNRFRNCSLWTSKDEPLSMVTATLDLHWLYASLDSTYIRSNKSGLLQTTIRNNQEWFPEALPEMVRFYCYSAIKPKICYFGGDPRVNQNPHLIVLEVITLRYHNKLAKALAEINPHWDDERLYQEARRINIAVHQHISYYELLPYYMGKEYLYDNLILYRTTDYVDDYRDDVCPSVSNEFSHAAFRHFHSMIVDKLKLISNERVDLGNISLKDSYNNPAIVEQHFDELTIGLNTQPSAASDINYVREINNNLFPKYKECGLDLRALDIQRSRDHGLPTYNTMRVYCGFKKAKKFSDFSDHIKKSRICKLRKFYKHVDDVELVVGGSYETNVPGALTGPVFLCIMREQFYRTRVGDPFWYEGRKCGFTLPQLSEIRNSSMAMMVCANGQNITQMQRRAFQTISNSNPLVSCRDIPQIDLNKWKEDPDKPK